VRTAAAIPALALLAGSALGLILPDHSPTAGCTALCVCAVVALWAWCASRPQVFVWAVALAFASGGAVLSATAWQRAWRPPLRIVFEDLARAERAKAAIDGRVRPEDDEAFATIEGVLRADAAPGASGVLLSVDVDRTAAAFDAWPADAPVRSMGGLSVTVAGSLAASRAAGWRAGRRIRAPVQLRRRSRYFDRGVPDYERALARRGTTLVGSVKSAALVDLLARGTWIDERLGDVRAYARRAIGAAVGCWSPRSAAIVAAIVIGDRAGLDEDVQRRLQEAGTYHVIAISGGNIAILAGLLLGLFRVAGKLGRGAMIVAIVVLVVYADLVGGGASVDRATLMAVVYFAARAVDQRSPPLNALSLVAAWLVAVDPLSVADPAFVLTFGATLAILIAGPLVRRAALPRAVRAVAVMFAASVATEALLFPVGAFVFSRVTFAGLALNFLAIPLMGIAQVAGMAVVPLALASSRVAAACGWVAHLGADGLIRSADLVRFAPALTYRVAPPNLLVCAGYYAGIAACGMLWRRRARTTGSAESRWARRGRHVAPAVAAAAAVWILAEPWTLLAARGDGRLAVTFLDVGQGDSALVRFPGGATLLVDTGGLSASSAFDIGDRVVAPVLRAAGIRRLDYLALTHGDPDHIGGARSVIEEFRPRQIWEGIPVPRFAPLIALRAQAEAAASRWTNVRAGDHLMLDEADVRAVHPGTADWERQKVRNDDSIVLEIRWRDVSVLLTGDIGAASERTIAAAIQPARLRVMKVPHHGSLTSSTAGFLEAVRPTVAVFSVGRDNHFGHPAPPVLERYRATGAQIFRTDRDGAVTVTTDGRSLSVSTYLGKRLEVSQRPARHEGTAGRHEGHEPG
jgi:competence protein ComEC